MLIQLTPFETLLYNQWLDNWKRQTGKEPTAIERTEAYQWTKKAMEKRNLVKPK